MKYRFIKDNRFIFPVVRMCQNLDVSKSGYYEWRVRKKAATKVVKESLINRISELFYLKHRQMAGSPLITEDLHDDPEYQTVHRSRVAVLMKGMGLRC